MRTVRYEEAARKAADDALDQFERANDAIQMFEWALLHDPTVGVRMPDSTRLRVYTLEGAQSKGLPQIVVIYEVTEEYIIIHSLRFGTSRHAQAGHA